MYRNLLPLFYCYWINAALPEKKDTHFDIWLLILIFVGASFYAFIAIRTFDTVVIDVLENNTFFKSLGDGF
jgi:hypothetical protein